MQILSQFMKWVMSVFGWVQHICENCGLSSIIKSLTILYEDNVACITQIRGGYIKGDRNKHIAPKLFYTHELQKSGNIDVKQILSCDNLADMFTKSLPTVNFKKMVHNIGMRRLKDIFTMNNGNFMYSWGRVNFLKDVCWLYSFSFTKIFCHWVFLCKVLMRQS